MSATYGSEGPKCPHCGRQYTADEDYYFDESNFTAMECDDCDQPFAVTVYTSTTWTCWPVVSPVETTALASASQSARPNDRVHDEPSPSVTTTAEKTREDMAFGFKSCGEASPDGEVIGHDTQHFDGKED